MSYVVTDLAVLRWDGDRFVIDAVAPGFTPQEVIALTEMEVVAGPKCARWRTRNGSRLTPDP